MNTDKWVDERMASLHAASGWQPNAARAFGRLRERDRTRQVRRWLVAAAGAAAACLVLLTVPAQQACASCVRPVTETANFRQSGSPDAPIGCEIYSDYECPACAVLFTETVPKLVEQYVKTGKVRLLHRDFPLPRHPYARLAASYANAAGALGQYDVVVNQLFRTQTIWGRDGNVDAQVARVLAPGVMQHVRALVKADTKPDEIANPDHVDQTPTIVIVHKGQRIPITGVVRFEDLKKYLDELLYER
ncbi:MAG: thioredoxin domain-containing protein [Acidobacteriota bacterium]